MMGSMLPKDGKSAITGTQGLSFAGLILIYTSIASFFALGYRSIFNITNDLSPDIYSYGPEVFLLLSGVFSALLGVGLIRSAGLSAVDPSQVINSSEWDIIKDAVRNGNEDAVTQYVRLTSLSGFTGFFTKLGLQGLPLATIGLTIFFSVLYLKDPEYLDLAKLTLGAFIGSFVQRQVGSGQNGGKVQLPTGETVSVKPPPPAPLA